MNNTTLRNLYQTHQGKLSDKWSLYLSVYDRLFSDFCKREVSLLEIGIQNGGSLEIWATYFPYATKLVGCDINPQCRLLRYEDHRIAVVVGDANLDETEKTILGHSQSFDLIIDDGSHRSSDIIRSFARYFPRLANGGLFVAEDLHCSYWQEFEGGLFDPYSSIAFFKRLADILNHEHWGIQITRTELLADFACHYEISFDEEVLSHIHSIEFINSMCVIRKFSPEKNQMGQRVIAGEEALVLTVDVENFNCSVQKPLDQSNNIWSRPGQEKDLIIRKLNELRERETQIANIENQISDLNEEVLEKNEEISRLNSQQLMLNLELVKLTSETSTVGAGIGRAITRLSIRIAPVGSRQGTAIRLAAKFLTTLASFGWNTASAKAYRYLSAYTRSKFIRGRVRWVTIRNQLFNIGSPGSPTIDNNGLADHPQLTAWFKSNEPDSESLFAQKNEAATFRYQPLLSVILPIYKVPRDVIEATLTSLAQQTYSNWEACIVWSDIDDIAGWEWLQAKIVNDIRFKIRLLSENGGISRNSNLAFEMVEGDYIALLDHDDTLAIWAFFEIVKQLQESPELDFIYSDKDSISADGMIRLNALFKPEWSPEMLHSVNYLTHLNVIRTCLVREVGGWRPETDGAQDWDLFFRITERTKNIARIPSILYHWRILPTSTATGLSAKPYAAIGQLKSQQDYFLRRGIPAWVKPSPEGMYQVCWPVHARSTDVVIFQNGNVKQLLTAIEMFRTPKQDSIRNLYIVHFSPVNDKFNEIREVWLDRVIFIQAEPVNWRTALDNILVGEGAETILLLDGSANAISNTLVDELSGWVTQHPDISWASAIALNADGTSVFEAGRVVSANGQSAPLFCGSSLLSFGWLGGPLWYRNTRACSPYAVAIKREAALHALKKLPSIEGTRDSFVAFCLELSAQGGRGLIDPFAQVFFTKQPEKNWPNEGVHYHVDPYFNPAFDRVSPLRLKS